MRCEEAAEFVSALCDGERISRDAAEHLDTCEMCRERLRDYVAMGVELRRIASAESLHDAPDRKWERKNRVLSNLWKKGWESMRIPRFAFGLLLVMVVILGSSLMATRARAHSDGSVLLLSVTPHGGGTSPCALSAVDQKNNQCGFTGKVKTGDLSYELRIISKDGDRIQLGLRAKFDAQASASDDEIRFEDMNSLREKQYWLEPGEKLEMDVAGLGAIEVTGEWMDHMPPWLIIPNMDPKSDELRVFSPVLLRGTTVVLDLEGGNAFGEGKNHGVQFYDPGAGLYQFSLSPIPGAVEGKIVQNRISFEIDHQPYTLLTGAPIARTKQVWIRHEAEFKPSHDLEGHAFIGNFELSEVSAEK
jgi:hypothetical protein